MTKWTCDFEMPSAFPRPTLRSQQAGRTRPGQSPARALEAKTVEGRRGGGGRTGHTRTLKTIRKNGRKWSNISVKKYHQSPTLGVRSDSWKLRRYLFSHTIQEREREKICGVGAHGRTRDSTFAPSSSDSSHPLRRSRRQSIQTCRGSIPRRRKRRNVLAPCRKVPDAVEVRPKKRLASTAGEVR